MIYSYDERSYKNQSTNRKIWMSIINGDEIINGNVYIKN